MLSVSLRQLEYTCAIARHGGLTAAASALNVSQPALSVALGLVERHLGQPLFLRRPGGPMVPTPFGRSWLQAADLQIDGFERLLSGFLRPSPLKLAVFEDIAPLILAPLLAATDQIQVLLCAGNNQRVGTPWRRVKPTLQSPGTLAFRRAYAASCWPRYRRKWCCPRVTRLARAPASPWPILPMSPWS